jgi:hypothetical protein
MMNQHARARVPATLTAGQETRNDNISGKRLWLKESNEFKHRKTARASNQNATNGPHQVGRLCPCLVNHPSTRCGKSEGSSMLVICPILHSENEKQNATETGLQSGQLGVARARKAEVRHEDDDQC